MNVLVTGVGAIIGYGIVCSLRKSKYKVHIIGMDIYSDCYGRYVCDDFETAIMAKEENYLSFLKKLMVEKSVDLVFFGTEQEIERTIGEEAFFGDFYSKLVLNRKIIQDLSNDKWETYKFLNECKLNAIPTSLCRYYDKVKEEMGTPFLLKPRKSYAGKGIEKIHTEEEFVFYEKKLSNQYMAQKMIGDIEHEYTATVFGYGDGRHSRSIIFRRKLSQEGATAKAERVEDKKIDEFITNVCKKLNPIGPTDFQFRYDNGNLFLLEINPRISSSTSIRTAFGYNEAEMCIEYYIENKEPNVKELKSGKAVRYIADLVVIE